MSNAWELARKRLKKRHSVAIEGRDGEGEVRFEETRDGKSVRVSIGEGSILLDWLAWEAMGHIRYEIQVDEPTDAEKAIEDLTKEEKCIV